MDIYISDKSKKDEYIKFVKFWEEKWYPEIIKKLFLLGVMATLNQGLSKDAIELLAADYGMDAEEKMALNLAGPGGKLHFRPALLLFCECFRAFCGGGSALFFASFARKW